MKGKLLVVIFLLVWSACKKPGTAESATATSSAPEITKQLFGHLPDGRQVDEYVLINRHQMQVSILTYGGIIRSIWVPDQKGELADVVLGYDSLQGYLDNNPYFGAIVGRYGNRIAKGRFSLEGVTYQLATNNIGNHLHGGRVGFDKVLWTAHPKPEESALSLTYLSQDMEEGYPGNLEVTVTYQLTDENELIISYHATTDQKTIVNLTSHSYFNLTGRSTNILGHQLMIRGSNYLPVDSTLIPKALSPVAGTPFDFSALKWIGRDIDEDHIQLTYGSGFDHCWILDPSKEPMKLAATLYDAVSGRKMDVYTEEPGLQFYSGNFLDGSIHGKMGRVYERRSGLCLETQHFPDSPNRSDFPSTVLEAGETYHTRTIYQFSVQQGSNY